MKKLLSKVGFHKQDEMEATIYLKSVKLAWGYT